MHALREHLGAASWRAHASLLALAANSSLACTAPAVSEPRSPDPSSETARATATAAARDERALLLEVLQQSREVRGCLRDPNRDTGAAAHAGTATALVSWDITADGKVENARIKSASVSDPSVDRCLIDRVSRLEFTHGAKTVVFSRTFVGDLKRRAGARARARSTGELSPARIQRTIKDASPVFRYCCDESLVRSPRLECEVTLGFLIGPDGGVAEVADAGAPSEEPSDREFASCAAEGLLSLRFPAPTGGAVSVVYPIIKGPGSD